MSKMINLDDLARLLEDHNEGASGGPKIDMSDGATTTDDDLDRIVALGGQLAHSMWQGKTDGVSITKDSQIVTVAECALTHVLAGYYEKPPRERPWATGEYVTITNKGAAVGDRQIQWMRRGRRHTSKNNGMNAGGDSPQRAIGHVWDTQSARRKVIEHKVQINWIDLAEAARLGFSEMEAKGRDLRREHMREIDTVIRVGSLDDGVRGIADYPGVNRRAALVDWGSAAASPIYDDYRACIDQIFASPTEEDEPAISILPRLQWRHIKTEQFSAASDTTLKSYIEENNDGHTIQRDAGLATAGPNGRPIAIFMTPREDLVWVTSPLFAQVQNPHQVSAGVMEIEIWTVIYGIQVNDEDTVLIVDGEPTGWAQYGSQV